GSCCTAGGRMGYDYLRAGADARIQDANISGNRGGSSEASKCCGRERDQAIPTVWGAGIRCGESPFLRGSQVQLSMYSVSVFRWRLYAAGWIRLMLLEQKKTDPFTRDRSVQAPGTISASASVQKSGRVIDRWQIT